MGFAGLRLCWPTTAVHYTKCDGRTDHDIPLFRPASPDADFPILKLSSRGPTAAGVTGTGMEPPVLVDTLSQQGVSSPSKTMAVCPTGQLIFKQSKSELIYYDTQEHSLSVMKISKLDPLYDHCQIFDLEFSRGALVVCLIDPNTQEFLVCEGHVDTQEHVFDVSGKIFRTDVFAGKGRQAVLLKDEMGVVLISFPNRFSAIQRNFVELFHVSNFMSSHLGSKYTINLTNVEKFSDTLSCPFIARNHLYLFSVNDLSKFVLVPLTGGKPVIRSTIGAVPPNDFLMKQVQAFEDFVLLYANQSQSGAAPTFFVLKLMSLRWSQSRLSLSSHSPNGKISMRKLSEDGLFLHGDCNLATCQVRNHLYLINVESVAQLMSLRSRSQSTSSLYCTAVASGSTQDLCQDSSPETAIATNGREPPVLHRFKKRQFDNEAVRRKHLPPTSVSKNSIASSSSASWESDVGGQLKRTSSIGSIHWSADMAEQCSGVSLNDQLRLASEWGYDQNEILAALRMNNKENQENFQAFESANAMLDILNQVTGRSTHKLSVFQPNSESAPVRRHDAPRSSSVSRSSSFHLGTPKSTRESHDLLRLLAALEKEKERDRKEVENQFAILKNRINYLEIEKEGSLRELKELRRSNETLTTSLEKERDEKKKLLEEHEASKNSTDKLTIQVYKLQAELHDHKELAEHRKKQYDEEMERKEEQLQLALRNDEQLSSDLARKCELLDEQTQICKKLEERVSELKTEMLMERLTEAQEKCLEDFAHIVASIDGTKTLFHQLQASMPINQQKEREKWIKERQNLEHEIKMQRRDLSQLQEKSIAECCICLITKPSVLFMPCKHLVSCRDCHAGLKECPTCRATIDEHIDVYT